MHYKHKYRMGEMDPFREYKFQRNASKPFDDREYIFENGVFKCPNWMMMVAVQIKLGLDAEPIMDCIQVGRVNGKQPKINTKSIITWIRSIRITYIKPYTGPYLVKYLSNSNSNFTQVGTVMMAITAKHKSFLIHTDDTYSTLNRLITSFKVISLPVDKGTKYKLFQAKYQFCIQIIRGWMDADEVCEQFSERDLIVFGNDEQVTEFLSQLNEVTAQVVILHVPYQLYSNLFFIQYVHFLSSNQQCLPLQTIQSYLIIKKKHEGIIDEYMEIDRERLSIRKDEISELFAFYQQRQDVVTWLAECFLNHPDMYYKKDSKIMVGKPQIMQPIKLMLQDIRSATKVSQSPSNTNTTSDKYPISMPSTSVSVSVSASAKYLLPGKERRIRQYSLPITTDPSSLPYFISSVTSYKYPPRPMYNIHMFNERITLTNRIKAIKHIFMVFADFWELIQLQGMLQMDWSMAKVRQIMDLMMVQQPPQSFTKLTMNNTTVYLFIRREQQDWKNVIKEINGVSSFTLALCTKYKYFCQLAGYLSLLQTSLIVSVHQSELELKEHLSAVSKCIPVLSDLHPPLELKELIDKIVHYGLRNYKCGMDSQLLDPITCYNIEVMKFENRVEEGLEVGMGIEGVNRSYVVLTFYKVIYKIESNKSLMETNFMREKFSKNEIMKIQQMQSYAVLNKLQFFTFFSPATYQKLSIPSLINTFPTDYYYLLYSTWLVSPHSVTIQLMPGLNQQIFQQTFIPMSQLRFSEKFMVQKVQKIRCEDMQKWRQNQAVVLKVKRKYTAQILDRWREQYQKQCHRLY